MASSMLRAPTAAGLAVFVPVVLAAVVALPLDAQQSVSPTGADIQWALLGGQSGLSGGVHRYVGVHASVNGRRWGGGVQLHRGTGNGYGSTFAAAGPTARVTIHPRAELQVMAGPAYYAESLDSSGRSGSVIGPAGSMLVRMPAGPIHLVGGVTGWYASFSDDIAVNPVPAEGVRLVLGIGL